MGEAHVMSDWRQAKTHRFLLSSGLSLLFVGLCGVVSPARALIPSSDGNHLLPGGFPEAAVQEETRPFFPLENERTLLWAQQGLKFFPPPVAPAKGQTPQHAEPAVDSSSSAQTSGIPQEEADVPLLEETVVEEEFRDPFEEEDVDEVYDPWEPFNEVMFQFNYRLDQYVIKPVARGYNRIVPVNVQRSIANAFHNLGFVPRLFNSLLQGKWKIASIEIQRFAVNSTIGVGGLFDVAKYGLEIEPPAAEDTGQTLGVYGVQSGPYLVLPLLPPLTLRDGLGFVADIFMNPVNYFIPVLPNLGANAGNKVNDRALHLEVFEGVEETTLDLYGAVRSAYFQRRIKAIRE
ncbi:MAG: VacJ family lipoprotein [Nitrospirae bacterium]|nr:MAG: VacJ family lipoprotein [Nitrospirota bacterium]